MEREEWLKSLKPGDDVVNKFYQEGGSYYYRSFKVKKVTPTGQIRLSNDILLNSNGRYNRHEPFGGSVSYDIEPLTEEILEYSRIRKKKFALQSEVKEILSKKLEDCKSWDINQLERFKVFMDRANI